MSKSTSKSDPKAGKASKSDILTKVKGAAVTKPAQSEKAKSKDVAKQVASKEGKDKKSKKVPVKEPTPEASSDEDEDDSEVSSDESESDSEVEVKPKAKAPTPATNGKKVAAATAESSDDSESDSASDSDSDEEDAPKVTSEKTKAAAESDSDDGSSDESESDEEKVAAPKVNGAKAAESDDDSEDDDGSSDSDSESEAKEETAAPATKRKAQDEEAPAAKKTKVDESANGGNLFVGNLSWNVDEDWLRQEFEEYGELTGVRLITDRATGRSKGYGYVEFANAADAAKAHAAKQGTDVDGRTMNIDFANAKQNAGEKTQDRRKSYGDQTGEPTDTLFVGNMAFECTNEDLSAAFEPHGTILSVRIPTDRESGQPKGFGYVTFSTVEEATGALEALQGGYIARRPVRLDYSQPRQNTGDSPARGRGGFGGRGGGRGFGDRGGRGGGRGFGGGRGGGGRGFGDRGGRGGRGGSTNRGGFGDFSGRKTTF